MAVTDPVKVKGAQIVTPIQILSFAAGLTNVVIIIFHQMLSAMVAMVV
jgi:hypothetical protein